MESMDLDAAALAQVDVLTQALAAARRGVAVAGKVQLRRLPLAELVHEREDDELVVAGRARVGQGRLAIVLAPVDGDAAGVACGKERHQEDAHELEGSQSSPCHGFSSSTCPIGYNCSCRLTVVKFYES